MAGLTFTALSDFLETVIVFESKAKPKNAKRDLPSWNSETQRFKQCGCLVYICDQSLEVISQEDDVIYVDNKKHSTLP